MNAAINGNVLAECFALVARCGNELEGLRGMLGNMLETELSKADEDRPCVIASGPDGDGRMDDSGWVFTDISYCIPLKAKGKGQRKIERYLGFQISMTGAGIAIPGNVEPLLHVVCWAVPCTFASGVYVDFPLEDDSQYPFQVADNRLVQWGEVDSLSWRDNEWLYSLRLTALNSADDLMVNVIKPSLALLKGTPAVVALPDSLPALVRYPSKEALTTFGL